MEPIKKLIDGFKQFKQHYYVEYPDLYQTLIDQGQSPKTLVIACCDSRANPSQLLNTEPGDIFVIRNVANLVTPFKEDGNYHGTSAAMEFAVKHLKVEHIVVMGHRQCGGIKSIMAGGIGSEEGSFIDPWMTTAMPTREEIINEHGDKSFEEQCHLCEQASIEASIKNLLTFPWIQSRVDAGEIQLHGWYFDLDEGNLLELNQENGEFSSV